MNYPKYFGIFLWLWFSSGFVVAQTCYKAEKRHSGIEAFYNESEIESKACELVTLISNMGGGDFTVYGIDFYPVMAFVNPTEGYDRLFDDAVQEKLGENYLMIVKERDVSEDNVINYKIKFKTLPLTNQGIQISDIEIAAFESEVQKYINSLDLEISSNDYMEIATIQKLIDYLIGEEEVQDLFQSLDFVEIPIASGYSFLKEQPETPDGPDFSGVKVMVNGVATDFVTLLQNANNFSGNDEIINLTWDFVVTDNHIASLDAANDLFVSSTRNLVVWIHLDNLIVPTEIPRLKVNWRDNLTEEQVQNIMDFYYNEDLTVWLADDEPVARNERSFCPAEWQWGKECLLPYVESNPEIPQFQGGMACGLIDGLLGSIQMFYDGSKLGLKATSFIPLHPEFIKKNLLKFAATAKFLYKLITDPEEVQKTKEEIAQAYADVREVISILDDKGRILVEQVGAALREWIGELLILSAKAGYPVGVVAYQVIEAYFTRGKVLEKKLTTKFASFAKNLSNLFKAPRVKTVEYLSEGAKASDIGFTAATRCTILGRGCFVEDTPVLMAGKNYNSSNNSFKISNAKSLAVAAAMPIVAVPIQEVQLLDYAVAHETVNSTYGLTASLDDDIYLGLLNKDPYTSYQQRDRDQYELDDENWYEVVFEEFHGGSTAKLALHNDWIHQKGYRVDAVVEMNLPEQGISGPFRITSIKHIIPQKKPVDDDDPDSYLGDDYDYRPVTALFTHESNQVYNIDFDNGESLGVTYQHPIFSTTAGDWKLAGELEIGEEVLTKSGNAKVLSSAKKEGSETVYNLEVKGLHNFLVGESGVVVHNACWKTIDDALNRAKTSLTDLGKMIKDGWDESIDWNPIDGGRATGYFGRGRFFEGLLWKGKYRKNGYKYTGLDDLGEGIGSQNYPIVDVYKGNTAVSIKTTRNSNPWSWINMKSSTNVEYNKKHLDDIIAGMDQGPGNPGKFGTHADLQNVQKIELDVYIRDFDTPEANVQQWQQMVDDYLTSKNQQDLIGKVKVNLAKVEDSL